MTCAITGSAVLTWCMLLVNKCATNRSFVIEALKLSEVLLVFNCVSPIHGQNQPILSRRQRGQFHTWVSQRSAEALGYSFPAVEKDSSPCALQETTTAQRLKFEFAWGSDFHLWWHCLAIQGDKPGLNGNGSLYSGHTTEPLCLTKEEYNVTGRKSEIIFQVAFSLWLLGEW